MQMRRLLRYPPPLSGVVAVAGDGDEVQVEIRHLVDGVAEDEVARRKWLRWTWTRDDCSHRLIGTFTLSLGIPRFAHHVESLTGSVCLSS